MFENLGGAAKYCDGYVCPFVCLSVCSQHISKTVRPNSTKFSAQVHCGAVPRSSSGGIAMFLCTFGFEDGVTF